MVAILETMASIQLTKEYFDKQLKLNAADIKSHMSKEANRLEKEIAELAAMSAREFSRVYGAIQNTNKSIEELARMTARGFEDTQKRLDIRNEVAILKRQMETVYHALHISP